MKIQRVLEQNFPTAADQETYIYTYTYTYILMGDGHSSLDV